MVKLLCFSAILAFVVFAFTTVHANIDDEFEPVEGGRNLRGGKGPCSTCLSGCARKSGWAKALFESQCWARGPFDIFSPVGWTNGRYECNKGLEVPFDIWVGATKGCVLRHATKVGVGRLYINHDNQAVISYDITHRGLRLDGPIKAYIGVQPIMPYGGVNPDALPITITSNPFTVHDSLPKTFFFYINFVFKLESCDETQPPVPPAVFTPAPTKPVKKTESPTQPAAVFTPAPTKPFKKTESPTQPAAVFTPAPTKPFKKTESPTQPAAVFTPAPTKPHKKTESPTAPPTHQPTTAAPTPQPTRQPTTAAPTPQPTPQPTTAAPTPQPTPQPTTAAPTPQPTPQPTTAAPTPQPTTAAPTPQPTMATSSPTQPAAVFTPAPTKAAKKTESPTQPAAVFTPAPTKDHKKY